MLALKFILFIELIGLFVCGVMHLIAHCKNEPFPLMVYFWVALIMLICVLLVVFVFGPLAEWMFEL